jgi:poly-gamma-glutamate capsule biosynthesis protein CapA/YwtB (metallophosphatase superfamily)
LLILFAAIVSSLVFSVNVRAQGEATVELVAVGDVLLDRGVARRIEQEGTARVFAGATDALAGADVTFGNLENPVASRCQRSRKKISFQARPTYADALLGAGFDVLSLANNHTLDCGKGGLLETIDHLKARGLHWAGAGRTLTAAEAPTILTVKGIKIAFVAFTDVEPESGAGRDAWRGVARASKSALGRAIIAARGQADVVVVSLHWGIEYTSRPSVRQRELAQAAVAAGADLVLGHHTHTLQGLEAFTQRGSGVKRRALVAYSLGNFVFDSPPALGRRVVETVVLRCKLNRSGLVSAEVRPVVIEKYLPRAAMPEESRRILARLGELSAELSTDLNNGLVRYLSPITLTSAAAAS